MRRLALLLALGLAASLPLPAGAQAFTAEQRLAEVAAATHVDPAWFSAGFLATLPAEQVDAKLAESRPQTGPFERVDGGGDGVYALRFASATQIAFVGFDSDAKISALILWPPQPLTAGGDPGRARVVELLSRPLRSETFATSMLAVAPLARLQEAVNGVELRYGRFVGVEGGDGLYRATLTNGAVWVAVHLDAAGAIDLLRFTAAQR